MVIIEDLQSEQEDAYAAFKHANRHDLVGVIEAMKLEQKESDLLRSQTQQENVEEKVRDVRIEQLKVSRSAHIATLKSREQQFHW